MKSQPSVYQFAIRNVQTKIRSEENLRLSDRGDPNAWSAFKAAEVLSVAFLKDKNEVLADLVAQ